jgi:conjugative relaxase-like TrwC/TraI family protein
MVTAKTQYNLANAKGYFEEHLKVGDYYQEGKSVGGEWFGEGAAKLGLGGKVGMEEFVALCENQNPITGSTLTQRQLHPGNKEDSSRRRIFYDFTFSPPKSVSIAGLAGGDNRILDAHHRALKVALREFEAFAATRVRRRLGNTDRFTGHLVGSLFTHDTSRALDCHIHTHCIFFNATYDPVEKQWKALQNHQLLRARKFAENVYYHELAKDLIGFGYTIRNRRRGDFEIEGIGDELCQRFSKRHQQIDQALERLMVQKPELAVVNLADIRERLAEAERSRKIPDVGRAELQLLWREQLTDSEWTQLQQLTRQQAVPTAEPQLDASRTLADALEWTEEHLFDRHSVVPEFQIWQTALERVRGQSVSVEGLKSATRRRGYVRGDDNEVTLRKVLDREREIVRLAREGVDCQSAVVRMLPILDAKLDPEQKLALERLLQSRDSVALFRGGAGTGKSFVLRELVKHVQRAGHAVAVLAPQRQQVLGLEKAGFPSPTTVTSFLQQGNPSVAPVAIVDEAGQIGGKQMLALLRMVKSKGGRLILSGDTRQHGPVEACDSLLAIERHAGLKPAELHNIRRQDPTRAKCMEERKQIKAYRSAVAAAAAGRQSDSFDQLERMGAIVECNLADQPKKLAEEYLKITQRNEAALVVSQTWTEVHRVNQEVRRQLKQCGKLGPQETSITALDKLDVTNAQKRDASTYKENVTIVFNQKVRHAAPGDTGKFLGIVSTGVLLQVHGRIITVEPRHLNKLTLCRPSEMAISPGDRLLLKSNRKLDTGRRVTNGDLVTVKAVMSDQSIALEDGRILPPSYREFLHGYAVTSYSSQGKTVDHVLFSDSTIKASTSSQQWYVTISRGRRGIKIFTSDKPQLRENITRPSDRRLALDLVLSPELSVNQTLLLAETDNLRPGLWRHRPG